MDIFKILSRGASIKKDGKHQEDLKLFKGKDEDPALDEASRDVDYFKTSKSAKDTAEEEQSGLIISNEDQAKEQRKKNKVKITGLDAPLPIGSFQDLKSRFDLMPHLLRNLQKQNFDTPTPIQSEAVPIMLRELDLIACAPTGTGKTLAFALPMVQMLKQHSSKGIRCLVISPTKELAKQIHEQVTKLSRGRDLNICILSKSVVGRLRGDEASRQKFDIMISTPKRLLDCLEYIDLSKVQHLIFDEADKLFERGFRGDGNSFAEQSDAILTACTNPKLRKAMFSATIPSGVEEMANSIMTDPIRVIVGLKEGASDTVEQKLVFTGNEEGKLMAIRQMVVGGEFVPPVIIFVQSIQRAKALFHELIYDKVNVDAIHGERTQAQRDRVIERFKQGDIWVLICTDVLSRGIDFQGVNLVINYDVPQTSQAYIHRIGRTGRAGKKGRAVTFFTKVDSESVKHVVNVMKQSGQPVGDWMFNMSKMSTSDKKKLKRRPESRDEISTVPKAFKKKKTNK
jgi:ATP-dependent RNA helicase DDX52/ROK1